MIDSIVVPVSDYDLKGFIEGYRKFYAKWSGEAEDADASISMLKLFGDVPENDYGERDPLNELLSGEWKLFFQMHEPLADETALCCDGKRRSSDKFDIDVADGYGFLVEVSEGKVYMHPALYDGSSGPFPSITLQGTCSVLEKAMQHFADKFRRKAMD